MTDGGNLNINPAEELVNEGVKKSRIIVQPTEATMQLEHRSAFQERL